MTTISAEHAAELYESSDGATVGPWTRVTEIAHEARRWMQGHSLIIRDETGAHWSLGYDLGLTEEQPHELPWRNGVDPIGLTRVYPHEMVRVVWRTTPPEVAEQSSDLLAPSEVAAMFRVDPRTVTRWAAAGRLTSVRTPGGHRRYREAEVRALLAGEPS